MFCFSVRNLAQKVETDKTDYLSCNFQLVCTLMTNIQQAKKTATTCNSLFSFKRQNISDLIFDQLNRLYIPKLILNTQQVGSILPRLSIQYRYCLFQSTGCNLAS